MKSAAYPFKKRKSFFRTTKYQRTIIRLAVLPVFAFCVLITAFCTRFRYELNETMVYGTVWLTRAMIEEWYCFILVALWAFFIFVLMRTTRTSSDLVGSFDRINRELDRTIRGEVREPMKAREYDELAKDLLERINILIDNLPEGPLKVR